MSQTKAGTPYPKRLKVMADGYVHTYGVDYETRNITVVAQNDEAIVVRVAGRSCWAGNYSPRQYSSPLLMVFKIVSRKGSELVVEPLIEWEVTRKKT